VLSLAIGFDLLFFGAFIVGIPLAITLDPPFPRVSVYAQAVPDSIMGSLQSVLSDNPDSTLELVGRLVTHREGVWHFFIELNVPRDVPDRPLQLANVLVSLPDDRVESVLMTERGA